MNQRSRCSNILLKKDQPLRRYSAAPVSARARSCGGSAAVNLFQSFVPRAVTGRESSEREISALEGLLDALFGCKETKDRGHHPTRSRCCYHSSVALLDGTVEKPTGAFSTRTVPTPVAESSFTPPGFQDSCCCPTRVFLGYAAEDSMLGDFLSRVGKAAARLRCCFSIQFWILPLRSLPSAS
jgi:hypothetical protein